MKFKYVSFAVLGIVLFLISIYLPAEFYNLAEFLLAISFVLLLLVLWRLMGRYNNVLLFFLFIATIYFYCFSCMAIQNQGVYAEHTEHYKVIANIGSGMHTKSGYEVYCFYELEEEQKYDELVLNHDQSSSMNAGQIVIYERYRSYTGIIDYNPSSEDILHFSKAVYYSDAGEEFGNDYYYYAKLRPDLALKNFGLNKLAIGKGNLLYYKNVNDSIDNQVHQCADSIQSQLNRDMLDTAKAFYFHGEIIPAKQLFSEVPQAREYYERYNKN